MRKLKNKKYQYHKKKMKIKKNYINQKVKYIIISFPNILFFELLGITKQICHLF